MVLFGLLPDSTVLNVVAILVATGFIWLGSGWLEESAEHLSAYYGLPAVVQGSIVVAVGSSFPELASVVFASLGGAFNMGVGAIVGSAIFNVLVIPALSGIVTDDELETSRTIVYKEAQFYMLAVSVLVVTFALAVIYAPVPGAPELTGSITRPLAVIPLLLYGLYLFIQWQDVSDHEAEVAPPGIRVGREWGRLAVGLLVILVAVEQLVHGVEYLGATFGIPEFLAGVTILAAATSLPDMLVSVRSARAGNGVTSLGNVLGSNTFDLLVALPIGVLIVGSVPIDFAVAIPMMGVLTLATVLLFAIMRTGLSLSTPESYALLVAYLAFVVWVVAETAGVTDLIRGA
ncbi:sodium:calcium antiporter [Haloarchaeobius sp. HME9146]|uniref:sodium:calcium antiporter n=1 Tax=Haloarchaeobius sp. HME9146 TaxID=2978732 RepID=UPI0021C1B80C|nr:sodium:calcium antiporter [Haloarchaeobius sp. HME9146]MCT9097932.1 sodium:calcium antiporter [Haloarchaeobius sp. HME9146]